MQIKIIVSSTSGINKIEHPEAISSIPDLIKYSDNETYLDEIQISSEIFLSRLKFDNLEATISSPDKSLVDKTLNLYFEQGYDEIIYVLPAAGVLYYDDELLDYISSIKNVKVYCSKLIGFPLCFLLMDLLSNITGGLSVDDALALLKKKENSVFLAFISPKNEAYNIRQIAYNNEQKHANRFFELSCSTLIEIKNSENLNIINKITNNKKNSSKLVDLNDFIKYCIKEIDNTRIIPFIEYSNENSYYIEYLEKKLLTIFPELKKIYKFEISPSVSNIVGPNAIGVGLIKLTN